MRFVRRSPFQTFVLVPLLVLGCQLALGDVRIQPAGLVLMLWGYAQYRLAGRYRLRLGGGGPGLSGAPPERLVESGIYARMRNPMYLGHILYLAGVAVFFSSWAGALIAGGRAMWFHARVLRDERGLAERFGEPYVAYMQRVKRWIPFVL